MISFFILYISFHFLLCGMHASTKMVPLALCAAASNVHHGGCPNFFFLLHSPLWIRKYID